MKIGLVVQRYGTDIVGGAENLCRGVAEGLAARGHDIEVLTSCARSYRTWANTYMEGAEDINGVNVRRFRVDEERDMASFNRLSEQFFRDPADPQAQADWIRAQGPYSPRLLNYLHEVGSDFDRLLFFTYLYYPTVHGIHVAPRRSILVPTAHDEAPIYLEIYESVFALPAGLMFNTVAEAEFVGRRFPNLESATCVAGVGIDNLEQLADPAQRAAVESPPVALYAGRIEAGKGVAEMLEYIRRYRRSGDSDLTVQLMGEVAMEIADEPWIDVLGFVDEDEKIRRLQAATVLIAPSALESFGIVVLEAMAAHTTVLVNAASAAAVEHCRGANAGLYYSGYDEFGAALDLLLSDPRLRDVMAQKGASYVRENYSWPEIVSRYERFLEELA